MPPSLQGRAPQADRHKGSRCRTRSGRLDADVLTPCWRASRQDAASGVEQGSAQADEQPLDAHSHGLVERLQPQRSRATRVRRHDRPTGDGARRPLGLPAVADPLLPRAGARLLEALDEQACLRGRAGYRPQVGALEAVETRTSTRQCGRDAWVGDADLQTCVDPIAQDGMVRRLAERSEAGARLRLLQQWLQAGVLDTDGPGRHPGTGTPHGGPVSPGLAKVCLHSVREVWGAQVVHQPWRGAACLLRDADDGVCACAAQAEAARVDTVLGHRLEQCGLELSAAQTRIIPVSRGRRAGKTSVAWLGCALRWGKDRQGNAHRKRRTPPARNSAMLCSAAPRGARRTDTSGCQHCARGGTPHGVGSPRTTECTGTPPACKSASPAPCGLCCRGSTGVANATVTRGKATTQCWSAAQWPDHGSLDDPRRGRQPSRPQPPCGSEYC